MIDIKLLDLEKLVSVLMDVKSHTMANQWRAECEIVPDYMPPFPRPDTKPICVVRHIPTGSFLRWSAGVRQGYFWDAYGEHCLSPELALLALLQAPPPVVFFRSRQEWEEVAR